MERTLPCRIPKVEVKWFLKLELVEERRERERVELIARTETEIVISIGIIGVPYQIDLSNFSSENVWVWEKEIISDEIIFRGKPLLSILLLLLKLWLLLCMYGCVHKFPGEIIINFFFRAVFWANFIILDASFVVIEFMEHTTQISLWLNKQIFISWKNATSEN